MIRRGSDGIWRVEGRRRVFNPSATSQDRFVLSTAPEILFTGPWGAGGKSVALCVKLFLFGQYFKGLRMGLGRKVRADMKASTLRILQDVVGPRIWDRGVRGGENAERLDFDNGSFIDFFGMDRREKLLSTDYQILAFDECNEIDDSDWEFAGGRVGRAVSSEVAILCGACNPDSPAHHLYHRFDPDAGTHEIYGDADKCIGCGGAGQEERWFEDTDSGRMWSELDTCRTCQGSGWWRELIRECIVASPQDNARNLDPRYLRRRSRLTGIRKLRYDLGRWAAFTGIVYDCFDPSVHVVGRERPGEPGQVPASWAAWGNMPPPDWPRYRSIDFGYYPAPFVCQWWAVSPSTGASYLYREIYHTKRTVRAHAAKMRELEDREAAMVAELFLEREQEKYDVWEWPRVRPTLEIPRPRYYGTYCDHDAEDRATLVEAGFANIPADKAITSGIEAVYEALQPFDVAGERRALLYFVRDALVELDEELRDEQKGHPTRTVEEIGKLLWNPPEEGRPPKQQTIGPDHAMDGMRYYVKTRKGQSLRILELEASD